MKFLAPTAAALCLLVATGASAEFKDFTVNGQMISKQVQIQQAEQVVGASHNPQAAVNEQLEKQVREWLTRVVAIAQYAKKTGLDQDPQVKTDLAMASDYVLYNSALADYVKKNPVSEKEIRAVYDKDKAFWGPTEYLICHIMVKTEKEAQELIAQIQKGGDFKKLAAEKSLDEDTKATGGELGWQSPSVFTEEFRNAVKPLKKGQVATKPMQSAAGWHVIYVANTRAAQDFPKFEEKKADIEQALVQQKLQKFIDEQVKKAVVK